MWYIEIVCSKEWIDGKINPSDAIVFTGDMILSDSKNDHPAEGVVYSTNNELHTLRMISKTQFDQQLVDELSDYNIKYWKSIIENFIRLSGDRFYSIYTPLLNNIMLTYGEGNKDSKPLIISGQINIPKPKIDFSILIKATKAFPRENTLYMQYLNRFTDQSIPLEMRWLNGYKIFELHYKYPLGKKNKQWINFLEEWRGDITPMLKKNQNLHGFIEAIRNDAAHAVNHINYKDL
jgi:hypothetical protein